MNALPADSLVQRHKGWLDAARNAIETRASWSPFKDSPSTKIHGAEKPVRGKTAYERRLRRRFELDQPGIENYAGNETSAYSLEPLGITYPVSAPDALIVAAEHAVSTWRHVDYATRVAMCMEIAARLYERNFEMAHAVLHVTGQSYTQSFSGSGPNALDRGIEALAYAAKAMDEVRPTASWRRAFGNENVALDKHYVLVPRGVALVVACASFPTWNAYPALFANLATGNAVILKPHPLAILPIAIVVEECRATLAAFGFDPNLVTLAVDTPERPIAQRYVDDPAVQIVDFTGSARYGSQLERTVTGKLLFTETAGVNSVVVESTTDLSRTATAIARATCLFSAQMCTSPQTIFVPRDGIAVADGRVSFDEVVTAIVQAINAIANDPPVAAGILGAIQAPATVELIECLAREADGRDVRVARSAQPYAHREYPRARTLTPLVLVTARSRRDLYGEERFGPVLFIVPVENGDEAVREATDLARTQGAIACYLYSHDDGFVSRSVGAYEIAGANLSINLHGGMWINFAAAYSDYHVTGLNPAGNACLADLAFVASRFRIVQRRFPASSTAASEPL